jgi:hypothetical protein
VSPVIATLLEEVQYHLVDFKQRVSVKAGMLHAIVGKFAQKVVANYAIHDYLSTSRLKNTERLKRWGVIVFFVQS